MDYYSLKLKIQGINKSIPNIEYGGCVTFSYHLHKVLKYKYGIETEIYYLDVPEAAIEYDVKFSHIILKWGDYFIDNNGLYYLDNKGVKDLTTDNLLTVDKLEDMLDNPGLWNNKFENSEKLIDFLYKI